MKTMGLDLGSRTIGIALSDPLKIIAQGLETFRFKDGDYESAIKRVVELVPIHQVDEIVLGLPLHMNGDFGDRAEICTNFKAELEKRLENVKIVMRDERLTTVIANRRLLDADLSRKKRKQVIDKMAGVEILQNYLDERR